MPYPLDPDRREIDLRHMIEGDKMKTAYLAIIGANSVGFYKAVSITFNGRTLIEFPYDSYEMDNHENWLRLKQAEAEARKWAEARGYTVEWQE